MNWAKDATERGLGGYHPLVSFGYYVVIIGLTLLFIHPVFALLSLVCAIIHAVQLSSKKGWRVILLVGLPLFLIASLANPFFNHHGSTYLFYFYYNPITLEAVVFGIVSATMMFGMIMWFFCYSEVVTSDKFLYIFGRMIPTVALIASMTLRLIPRLMHQARVISNVQRGMGISLFHGSVLSRVKGGARIVSVLVSWALEDAVLTADSMRSRGYGSFKRSSFSIYRFYRRDAVVLGAILSLAIFGVAAYLLGFGQLLYFPAVHSPRLDGAALLFYFLFLLLALLPILLTLREDIRWESSM